MSTPDSTPHARAGSASWWLRVGQSVLFGGLLLIATGLAAARGAGWSLISLAVVLMAVFVCGMVWHRRLAPALVAAWVGLMFALLLVLMWLAPEFLWVAFPLWMVAAATLPLLVALLLAAVTVAMSVTVLVLADGHSIGTVLGPVTGALVAIGIARGVIMLEREMQENQRLLRELVGAQHETARLQREAGVLEERARLAHDIHDTLAQGFSSVVLLARAATREPEQERKDEYLHQIEQSAATNLADARRVVYALAPENPGAGGIAEPLTRLTEEAANAIGATASVRIDPQLPRLATTSEVALLHGAQGALANVRQHSGATRLALELVRSGDEVRLDVVDDGKGFDPANRRERSRGGGYGLTALRERLALLGGTLEVESEPGGGTAVSLSVPLRVAGEGS
ncbi:MAG: sensor histidine kinase [bacterium]|nr:sensor histidine kinase [bacterium]